MLGNERCSGKFSEPYHSEPDRPSGPELCRLRLRAARSGAQIDCYTIDRLLPEYAYTIDITVCTNCNTYHPMYNV